MKRTQAAWSAGEPGAALALWEPLAEQGVARAQSNLGAALLEGRGVSRDVDKAVDWLKRAAEQGDAGGQRNLALCHYEGWGVPADRIEALHWLLRAGANGAAELAAEFLGQARAGMESLDTAEAERRPAAPLPKSPG